MSNLEIKNTQNVVRNRNEIFVVDSSPFVLGIAGRTCAGKDTLVSALTDAFGGDYSVDHFRFSDRLTQIIESSGAKPSVEKYSEVTLGLKHLVGPDALSQVMNYRTMDSSSEIVIWNGMRTSADVQWLRRQPNHFLVYLDIPDEIAFARFKERKRYESNGFPNSVGQFQKMLEAVERELAVVRSASDLIIDGSDRASLVASTAMDAIFDRIRTTVGGSISRGRS